MIPIVEAPQTIAEQMKNYRDIFCREEGFNMAASRYNSRGIKKKASEELSTHKGKLSKWRDKRTLGFY